MEKRTKKDEDDYNAELRREEPLKTEIIVMLRADRKRLLLNQQKLLTNLLHATADLQLYRAQVLERTEQALKVDTIPGFYWDNVDGWHRL